MYSQEKSSANKSQYDRSQKFSGYFCPFVFTNNNNIFVKEKVKYLGGKYGR